MKIGLHRQSESKRTGLERWKDVFKVLRKNCETDWAPGYPQYAVSTGIGRDIQVSACHYLQVPAELYKKVASSRVTVKRFLIPINKNKTRSLSRFDPANTYKQR